MKYKVLKDYIGASGVFHQAGSEAELINDGSSMFIALLAKGFIEEIKPEYKRWRAEDGQLYYAVTRDGVVQPDAECHAMTDNYRYATGNYFKTEEEAEAKLAYDLALQVIKDDAEGFEPDWSDGYQRKWWGFYDHGYKALATDYWMSVQTPGMVWFPSKKAVVKSQEIHKQEWLTVLGIKEEK